MSKDAPVELGKRFVFRKTVGEADVYMFAGITGDLSPNHVDEAAMAKTRYGGRIAHGALIMGYMSNCSTLAVAELRRDLRHLNLIPVQTDRDNPGARFKRQSITLKQAARPHRCHGGDGGVPGKGNLAAGQEITHPDIGHIGRSGERAFNQGGFAHISHADVLRQHSAAMNHGTAIAAKRTVAEGVYPVKVKPAHVLRPFDMRTVTGPHISPAGRQMSRGNRVAQWTATGEKSCSRARTKASLRSATSASC